MTSLDDREVRNAKKPRGCLFYGLVTLGILIVLGGVGGYFGIRYLIDHLGEFTQKLIKPYTETEPMPIPVSQMPPEEYAALQRRVAAFFDAVDKGAVADKLVLTDDDLNALIANHPSLAALRGKLHVSMTGDEARGDISIPLDEFVKDQTPPQILKGRFLNGAATVKFGLIDDVLTITLVDLDLRGKALPANVIANLRAGNMAQNFQGEKDVGSLRERFQRIEIAAGKLVLQARPAK